MLAFILTCGLIVEFAAYAALGSALAPGLPGTLLLALGLAIAWRSALVALGFAMSRAQQSAMPPEMRIGAAAALAMFARECAAQAAMYAVLQPLERWLVPRRPARIADGPVVLLVHGIFCNGAAWWSTVRALRAAGVANLYTLNLEPVFGGIDAFAERLARRIDEVIAETGARNLVLVAHSMGGLVAREHLRQTADRRIASVITLGSPHHGSVHARFAAGRAGRQMTPGSAFLAALAREGMAQPAPPVVSIYSWHDNLVAPAESSMLPGAKNVALSGIGHVSLLFSARVHALVLDAVTTA